MDLTKVEREAPGLISLAKKAAVSLEKNNIADAEAEVFLVLDHSGSMFPFYENGSVQRLAEQTLALAVNLDDDGRVPLVYFGSEASIEDLVELHTYEGIVEQSHYGYPWGSTNYVDAMDVVINDYRDSMTGKPVLAIFQTDGNPDSRRLAEQKLIEASNLPIFWAFVGFGPNIDFLKKLDDLRGRRVDNASFFHAIDPLNTTDEALYEGITKEFAEWRRAAALEGII